MSFLQRLTDFEHDNHPHVASDFYKRYRDTYLLMNNELIYHNQQDGNTYYFKKVADNTNIIYKRGDPDLNIVLHLPKVGYYNINGIPTFLFKNPQKQYKRSMCNSVYTTDNPMLYQMNREQLRTYWDTVALETLHPEYAHLDDIQKKILGYVAINSKFAIKEDNLIYRKYPIGRLNFDKRYVEINQPALLQEVLDLFKYTGVQSWTLR